MTVRAALPSPAWSKSSRSTRVALREKTLKLTPLPTDAGAEGELPGLSGAPAPAFTPARRAEVVDGLEAGLLQHAARMDSLHGPLPGRQEVAEAALGAAFPDENDRETTRYPAAFACDRSRHRVGLPLGTFDFLGLSQPRWRSGRVPRRRP